MTRTRLTALTLTAVFVAALESGCASLRHHRSSTTSSAAVADVSDTSFVDLQIDNHNWSDVVVSIVHGGTRTRLGTVHTASTTVLKFPFSYAFANAVSLVAAPIGSPSQFESERFRVLSGQRVYWSIESSLARSSLVVR
jgi:uncharacterized protein YceK